MSSIYKHVIQFSLLIVGVVLLTHSVIPHDHHYNLISDINHHNDNSEKEPIHCHYFNNIDFSKIKANNFTNFIKKLPVIFTVILPNLFDTDLIYQVSNFISTSDNLPDYYVLISTSPTRGSPLV